MALYHRVICCVILRVICTCTTCQHIIIRIHLVLYYGKHCSRHFMIQERCLLVPELKILSQNVLKIRHEMGESQSTFASGCGISIESLSKIERCEGNPRLSTLQNIAAYTNYTVADLVTDKKGSLEAALWNIITQLEKM